MTDEKKEPVDKTKIPQEFIDDLIKSSRFIVIEQVRPDEDMQRFFEAVANTDLVIVEMYHSDSSKTAGEYHRKMKAALLNRMGEQHEMFNDPDVKVEDIISLLKL